MAKKYDAILLYSDDIWNNNREGDFSGAEVIMKGKASETNCETYFPCGLYYELGSTDDLGYQCLDISSDDKKYGFEVVTIVLLSPDGRKIPLEYPTNSRQYPVTFGGKNGQAVSFFVDGVETYRSSKNAKAKAKKFIEERIEKLRSCDAPFAAESMEMGMEEMASEFSVERINPTPVSGKADMKAESFGAEENLAVADVDIHDGMNIPAGSGAIIGQAIPETDFTPFGASAEDTPVPADPRVSPMADGLHIPANSPALDLPRENAEIGGVDFKADSSPLPPDPRVSPLNKGLYSPSDTPKMAAEDVSKTQVQIEMGDSSGQTEGYQNRIFSVSPIDEGDGSIDHLLDDLETLIEERVAGWNATYDYLLNAESFGAENPPVPADPRVSPLNKRLHTPSNSPEVAAEMYEAYEDPISERQEYKITELGGELKDMTRSEASDYIKKLQGRKSGTWRAETMQDPMPNESAIVGQTSDGTPYTRFGYAAENLAIKDVEIWDGMVLPEGTGSVMGQMTPTTDFTPFGVSAESYMEETFKPDGMGEVVGAITAETDYTPFGASAEEMQVAYAVMWEGKDDDNDGLIYGIEYMDGEEVSDVEWFKTSDERDAELKQYISDFGAEAFGGDLASLNDYNGVESVRVEAPLGHGVTENLGAEEMDTYGGLMGVAAAFIGGMAFSHWSKGKTSGDDAPDSENPSEESDDAPQA